MPIKIFTVKFDYDKNNFNSDEIDDFSQNKKINQQQANFFILDGVPYWSVFIDYEVVVAKDNILHTLSKSQKILYMRLKEWRKLKAEQKGLPYFLVATNSQLEQMVKQKCVTLSALESIKGYGKMKVSSYGNELIEIIKKFYEYPQK